MSDEGSGVHFEIGKQEGIISNVAGDMVVHGGQQYMPIESSAIARELDQLRAALARIDLDPDVRERAEGLLGDADRELRSSEPEATRAAEPIERLTTLLKDVGAVTAAGAAILEPIRRVASMLHGAGESILALIR